MGTATNVFMSTVLLCVVGIAVTVGIKSNSGPTDGRYRGTPAVAWSESAGKQTGCSAARRAVREQLKAPSTAKFGDCVSRPVNSQTALVTIDVDAQNSFGAMLRKRYVVRVTEWGSAEVEGSL
jgi:hypothetical protein